MALFDSGNYSDLPTATGDVKTKALLEGMRRLGYRVVNVGERDIKAGHAKFLERAKDSPLPFVSANIVVKGSKKSVFDPFTVIEAASTDGTRKLRIGVIGLARFNPLFSAAGPGDSEMVIVHPKEPLASAMQAIGKKKVDLVVVLAALHRDDARRLIGEFPGIDYVIGSYGGLVTTATEREGSTWIVYAGNQGKRIAESRMFLGGDGEIKDQVTRMHVMGTQYPYDQPMLDFVNSVFKRDTPKGAAAKVGTAADPARGPFVGTAVCRTCHEQAYEQWKGTGHARAVATLAQQKKSGDAACLTCHTTGMGTAGGFESLDATKELADVGCESCHGPGRSHVLDVKPAYGKMSASTCSACHDRKNSPKFDYYEYLAKVKHTDRAVSH
ncbi:MAG: hypothetical protein GY716_24015 [bacterium]|nr:hypothetical protein [bacterium]